jgi:hypothetical protein
MKHSQLQMTLTLPPDQFFANAKVASFGENDCVLTPGGTQRGGVPGGRAGAPGFFLLGELL